MTEQKKRKRIYLIFQRVKHADKNLLPERLHVFDRARRVLLKTAHHTALHSNHKIRIGKHVDAEDYIAQLHTRLNEYLFPTHENSINRPLFSEAVLSAFESFPGIKNMPKTRLDPMSTLPDQLIYQVAVKIVKKSEPLLINTIAQMDATLLARAKVGSSLTVKTMKALLNAVNWMFPPNSL